MQAVWSAAVPQSHNGPIVKPLYSDAGSGFFFNLAGDIRLGDVVLPKGVIVQSVSKGAGVISMSPGARIAGVRFLPAVGFAVLGQHYEQPTVLTRGEYSDYSLYELYDTLKDRNAAGHIELLFQWAEKYLSANTPIPDALHQALTLLDSELELGKITSSQLSQRQLERIFKQWLGITPKHYQRILRLKRAINYLRSHSDRKLVDVAHQFGYTDQAHMTREFRTLACITPGKL